MNFTPKHAVAFATPMPLVRGKASGCRVVVTQRINRFGDRVTTATATIGVEMVGVVIR